MKKLATAFLIIIFLLSACGQPALVPVIENATAIPSSLPSNTSSPTHTPTASITPLPTIPTFTPTFDASTIVTVTPAARTECPKEDSSVIAKFATPNSDAPHGYVAPQVLDYLNSGGTATQLRDLGLGEIVDLNGDGVNELVYRGIIKIAYIIFGCKDGKYHNFLDFAGDSGAGLVEVLDLNNNETPEVVLYKLVHYGYIDISIFEWDGNKYHSLIQVPYYNTTEYHDWISATEYPKFMDTDKDGLKEIVLVFDRLCGGFGDFCDGTPRRQETTVLAWNGKNYVVQQSYYAPAQYRFQAIQDGDAEISDGNLEKALIFYEEVIFSKKLQWWSLDRKEHEVKLYLDSWDPTKPTPLPEPPEDKTEYPRLAAYAYYRIMLLHFAQGQESEAATTYQTLQETFGNDPYARPYVEMATAFWEAYQPAHSVYDGCAAAIQYAVEHPEILIPLGSDYHGTQSHIYVPADVCPFR